MKIGISRIILDHLYTLRDIRSSRISLTDLSLFYVLPILVGCLSYWKGFVVSTEVYNVSITFFGIFIALLLNIQVAIFGIFQRRWENIRDVRLAEMQNQTLEMRKKLLSELNSNISYLILLSCVALTMFLIFFVRNMTCGVSPSLSLILYIHFLLTLFMIVKRSHSLFQREYGENY